MQGRKWLLQGQTEARNWGKERKGVYPCSGQEKTSLSPVLKVLKDGNFLKLLSSKIPI